jgi:methanogenic corrinoid protein MtbC1
VADTVQALGGEFMDLRQIYEMVIAGDALAVRELVQQALYERVPPSKIISECLISAMTEVGDRF